MAECVFVTGLPSLLARLLVAEWLERGVQVVSVVRAQAMEEAVAWAGGLPPKTRTKLVLLEGELTHIDLGLSGEELRRWTPRITRIIHTAQVTFLGGSREKVELANVGAAREVIEVAKLCPRLKCLVALSSALVSGDRTGVVRENELRAGQRFRNPVEETLARAEALFLDASVRLPVAIVRPSMIVGHSQTGEVDTFDGPYLFILLMLVAPPEFSVPLLGRGDAPLHIVPVDFVAKALVAVALDADSPGRTFHIVDPAPMPARRAFELVARAGGMRDPRGSIPANLAKALLRTPGLDRFVKNPRRVVDALVTSVWYDARNAEDVLQRYELQCPPVESYVERIVQFARTRVQERRAPKATAPELVDDALLG
jgi:thioester reductase-like protein